MRLIPAVFLMLAILVSSCSERSNAPAESAVAAAPMAQARFADMAEPMVAKSIAPPLPNSSSAAGIVQRVIIRNANLTLVVKDAEAELQPLADIASRFGGFVAQSGFSRSEGGATSGTVQLRVDAARLDQALEAIRQRAIEVRDLNISSEDVTGEVVDVEARLRNLKSAEEQLHSIMQQAKKTEDVMAVFGQLTQTRGEIEQATGRLKYLRESATLSTVTLSLQADADSRPVTLAGWKPTGTVKRAVENLFVALQGLADFAIWAVIVLAPLLILVVLPLGWLLRRWRRSRAARKALRPA